MRVEINGGSMATFLATDPTMQTLLRGRTEAVTTQAEANAPVKTGYFRRHFEMRPYRGGFRVWDTDPFAHLVEWGSINNPAYAPIRRAVRSSGLRYRPNPESRGA